MKNLRFIELGKDFGCIFARIALGIIFLAHGSQKLFCAFGGRGLAGTIEDFEKIGYHPGVLWGTLVAFSEFFGGLFSALRVSDENFKSFSCNKRI